MRILKGLDKLFGGGGGSTQPYVINQGPAQYFPDTSAADAKAAADATTAEAKRTSLIDSAKRQGASASLLTSPDLGTDFSGLKTRKTTLGNG